MDWQTSFPGDAHRALLFPPTTRLPQQLPLCGKIKRGQEAWGPGVSWYTQPVFTPPSLGCSLATKPLSNPLVHALSIVTAHYIALTGTVCLGHSGDVHRILGGHRMTERDHQTACYTSPWEREATLLA